MTVVLWLALALVVIVAAPLAVNRSAKALHAHKYRCCLANIERIETELGWRPALSRMRTAQEWASAWHEGTSRWSAALWESAQDAELARQIEAADRAYEPPEPAVRVLGWCELCSRKVALNAGRCRGYPKTSVPCAKEAYRKPHLPRNRGKVADVDGLTTVGQEDAPSS